jgi:hypothetical protein
MAFAANHFISVVDFAPVWKALQKMALSPFSALQRSLSNLSLSLP